jgi:UDP-N-acetylglucosamine 2-epimerase (non-hydrolysing)
MKTALVFLGTRPEAVKLAPVIHALNESSTWRCVVCTTGQHRDLVLPILQMMGIDADHDLSVMRSNQTLAHITAAVTTGATSVLSQVNADVTLVQGDTTTAFAAALASFYQRVPVAHVEAGLRTGDIYSPWPEEANRAMIARVASYHFAPTKGARDNLVQEGIGPANITVTGNTVVDAALAVRNRMSPERRAAIAAKFGRLLDQKTLLFTMHRRESFGEPMRGMFAALRKLVDSTGLNAIFPVHPNPNVRALAQELLGNHPRIFLTEPLNYDELIYALERVRFVATDSGGLVEEAPTFGKPVLVLRDVTERMEAVAAGCATMCGLSASRFLSQGAELARDGVLFRSMSQSVNPFGDGAASNRIVAFLDQQLARGAPAESVLSL